MARKNPFPENELKICRRIREFRKGEKLSQVAFAAAAEIDSSALASIEHARAPLRYGLAWRLVNAHLINPSWLATGKGHPQAREGLPVPESAGVDPSHLYSEVFAEWMKERGAIPHSEAQTPEEVRARCEWVIEGNVLDWLDKLPDDDVLAFTERLLAFGEQLRAKLGRDSDALVAERAKRRAKTGTAARFKVFRRSHYK